jgi:nucleoside-diphosphate-sugar epimerase
MIFLLGGNGFVGSGFVKYLNEIGIPFIIIGRDNYHQLIGSECDVFINANGNSKKFLAKNDPKMEFQASVASVRNSLIDFKFKKYVFLSTSDVYPDCSMPELTLEDTLLNVAKQSPYGFHKHIAELCVQHGAEDWLILRQGGFVGQGLKKNAVFDILYGDKLWVHPESRFQFINTEDSARLVIDLIQQNIYGQIFNLTATGTISANQIMYLVGRKLPFDTTAKPVCYEIATEKVSNFIDLPSSVDAVKKFIKNLHGN